MTVKGHENGEPEILSGDWKAVPFTGEGMAQEIMCHANVDGAALDVSVVLLSTTLAPGDKIIAYVLFALSDGPTGPFEDTFDEQIEGDGDSDFITRTYNRLIQKALEEVHIAE